METSLSIWSHSTGPPVAMASEVPASGSLVPSPVSHSPLVLWEGEGESYAWHALCALDTSRVWAIVPGWHKPHRPTPGGCSGRPPHDGTGAPEAATGPRSSAPGWMHRTRRRWPATPARRASYRGTPRRPAPRASSRRRTPWPRRERAQILAWATAPSGAFLPVCLTTQIRPLGDRAGHPVPGGNWPLRDRRFHLWPTLGA